MSKMLDEFMKRFEQSVVEGKENVEAREAAEKKAADEAALEEQRLIKEEQELLERRATRLGELAANLKYLPMVEKIIDMHYLADGITVFARTTDGNAYEFTIRPAEYAKGFGNYRKPSKPAKEQQVNEISLKTKVNAYSRAMDPEFDYYADGTHNPDRKLGQAERIRAIIAKKHGAEAADQADDQAAYDHYGDYMFKDREVPAHVKQREPVNELSDKRLKKYVKKATKSADALQYYSDSRNDPDWEKAQKRKKMVDVAKGKLAKTNEAKANIREIVFKGVPFSVAHIDDEYTEDGLYQLVGPGKTGVMRYHDLKHAVHQCKFENKEVRKRFKTPAEFYARFGIKESFPYDVDHMPGPTVNKLSKGCTTCHGHKVVYKLPDGSVRADNVKGAKRVACPTCKGTGIKESHQESERERAERLEIEYYNELKREKVQNEIRKHRDEERKRMKKAFDYTPKKWVKENSSDAARIVVKPSELTHPDDDGAVERAPKDQDVSKSIKDTSTRYDVHVVKDFGKYTKNK